MSKIFFLKIEENLIKKEKKNQDNLIFRNRGSITLFNSFRIILFLLLLFYQII